MHAKMFFKEYTFEIFDGKEAAGDFLLTYSLSIHFTCLLRLIRSMDSGSDERCHFYIGRMSC